MIKRLLKNVHLKYVLIKMQPTFQCSSKLLNNTIYLQEKKIILFLNNE